MGKEYVHFCCHCFRRTIAQSFCVAPSLYGLCLAFLSASTIYLINDLVDVERDRLHPKKQFRPIASGRLPVAAWQSPRSIILPSVALVGAWFSEPAFCYTLMAYLALHLAYSFGLKSVAILDIFAISGGFILRVVAGVVVISVSNFSPYLYVCMGLLSLFLAIGKRRQEFIQLGDDATNTGFVQRLHPPFAG
jgi:4-hydroxybenzoate polyprenyltransferase